MTDFLLSQTSSREILSVAQQGPPGVGIQGLPGANGSNALFTPKAFPCVQPNQIISRFQAGHGWTATAQATGTLNDTVNTIMGTQAATWATKGAGAQAGIRNTAITAFSAVGKAFRILLRVQNVAHLTTLSLYAGDTGFANFFLWNIQSATTNPDIVYYQDGEWLQITLNWHDASITGTPNRAAITALQLAIYDDNTGQIVSATAQSVELILDGSAIFPNGVISITFDDSYASAITLGRQELDVYGYPATSFQILDLLDTSGRATLIQTKQAQDYSGWEIGAHAATLADHAASLTALDPTALEADFAAQIAWGKTNGITIDGLAYPNGAHNAAVIAAAKRYFNYGRTICPKPKETPYPANPFKLRSVSSISSYTGGVAPSTLTATGTGHIDLCKANASWLILCLHQIVTVTPTATSQLLQSDLAAILAKANSAQVPVMTMRAVLAKLT